MVLQEGQKSPSRKREKSEAAFRTISEVATDLDLPQHVLRFWETKFTQIKPLKRGGGRRYYRPEDVALLRRIRALLYEDGFTIRGVQRLLRQNGGRISAIDGVSVAPQPPSPGDAGFERNARKTLKSVLEDLEEARDLLRNARK